MALKLEDQAPLLFRYLHDVIGEYYMSKSFGDSISTYLSVVVSSSEQDKRSKMQLLEKLNFQEEKGKVDSLLKAQGLEVKKNSEKILDLYCDFCAKMLMIEDKNLYYILRGVGIEGENCFECIKNITDESILHPVIRMMVKIKQEEIEKEVVLDLVWYNMRKKEEEAQKEKEAAAQEKEQDKLKKDTKNMMQEIRKMHFIQSLYILSGDKKSVVEKIAKELQITNYYGEFNPIEKYNFINDLEKYKHYNVLMLGDGLNDSAALKIANVSMSPSSGIDITQNCADIIFTGNMTSVPCTLNISRQSQNLMKQNVILAIIYNITSIPVAMFGFVTPLVAAIVMSSSSIIVILNALRLTKNKRF